MILCLRDFVSAGKCDFCISAFLHFVDSDARPMTLFMTDLRHGPKGLISVARAIRQHGVNAKEWVSNRGLDGILLAEIFPQFIGNAMPRLTSPTFLHILSQNQDDIASLIQHGRLTAVEQAFDLLAKESERWLEFREGRRPPFQGDWLKLACEDAHTIRFIADTGHEGFRVLEGLAKEQVISDGISRDGCCQLPPAQIRT